MNLLKNKLLKEIDENKIKITIKMPSDLQIRIERTKNKLSKQLNKKQNVTL